MKADQLSQSAAYIAIKFYGLTQYSHFRSLFDEEIVQFYDSIVCNLPRPLSYYHYWLQYDWVRALYMKSEELLLPGDLMHILARKWYISRILDDLLKQGYEQILVLGGGFDHVAYHFKQRGIPSFEIDSPRMARLKESFLNECYPDKSHPDIIPAQLSEDSLIDILEGKQAISSHKKTVIISEGFFDYLAPKEVSSLLATLQNYFTKPVLLSTHFALDELSPLYRTVFRSSLNLVGEQLQFNASIHEFKTHLSNHHFDVDFCYGSEEIRGQFISQIDTRLDILKGFYILSVLGHSQDL